MSRSLRKRVQAVHATLGSAPVDVRVERAAFDRFRQTGELPDAVGLASAIARRCVRGLGDRWEEMDRAAQIRHAVAHMGKEKDEVLHRIYDEAIWGEEHVRLAARAVLRALAKSGYDVTVRVFEGVGIADVFEVAGGVGVWLLDPPGKCASVDECVLAAPAGKEACFRAAEAAKGLSD